MTTFQGQANVVVVGPSGAGKSTLARAIGAKSGLRVVELDALAWNPGWDLAPDDEFRMRVGKAIASDGWIVDGNYSRARDLLWARAGTVVWLDLPLSVILPRIMRRSWRRWRSKELLWGSNRETFWAHFLPGDRSLIWFTARTFHKRRRDLQAAMADPEWQHLTWMRFRSTRELERWVESLPGPREPAP